MINRLRRKLVGGLLSATVVSILAPTIAVQAKSYDRTNITSLSSNEIYELRSLYYEWIRQGNDLASVEVDKMTLDLTNPSLLQDKFKLDFEEGNIFIVNGLVLSYSEAAILAGIGAILSNDESI